MTAACASALLTGVGAVALADDEVAVDHDEYGYDTEPRDTHLMSGIGTSVQIGAGVFGFTQDSTRDFMDTGGSWTARLVVGTRMPLALEAAYIGTANNISALGLDGDSVLLSNGAEADLRWNIFSTFFRSIDTPVGHFDPYVFGGVAYRRYQLVNDDFNTSSVREKDNVGEVPMGGGVNWMMGGFAIDTRAEYRLAFSDDLFAGDGDDNNDLNTWTVSARLGWEF